MSNSRNLWLPQKKKMCWQFLQTRSNVFWQLHSRDLRLASESSEKAICTCLKLKKSFVLKLTYTDGVQKNVTGFRKPAFVLSGPTVFKVVFCGFFFLECGFEFVTFPWSLEVLLWRHVLCKDNFFPFLLWLYPSTPSCSVASVLYKGFSGSSIVAVLFLQCNFSFAVCPLFLQNLA